MTLYGGVDDETPFLREARKRHCPRCPCLIYCRGGVWPTTAFRCGYCSYIHLGPDVWAVVVCTEATVPVEKDPWRMVRACACLRKPEAYRGIVLKTEGEYDLA